MKTLKILSTMTAILLAASISWGGTMKETWKDFKSEVDQEISQIETSLKQAKAEAEGDDLEAARYEAMNEVSKLKEDIAEKFDDLSDETGEKAEKLRSEIKIAMERIRKKADKYLN